MHLGALPYQAKEVSAKKLFTFYTSSERLTPADAAHLSLADQGLRLPSLCVDEGALHSLYVIGKDTKDTNA